MSERAAAVSPSITRLAAGEANVRQMNAGEGRVPRLRLHSSQLPQQREGPDAAALGPVAESCHDFAREVGTERWQPERRLAAQHERVLRILGPR